MLLSTINWLIFCLLLCLHFLSFFFFKNKLMLCNGRLQGSTLWVFYSPLQNNFWHSTSESKRWFKFNFSRLRDQQAKLHTNVFLFRAFTQTSALITLNQNLFIFDKEFFVHFTVVCIRRHFERQIRTDHCDIYSRYT